MSARCDRDVEDNLSYSALAAPDPQSNHRREKEEFDRPTTAIGISRGQSLEGGGSERKEDGAALVTPRLLAGCCCQQPSCAAFQRLQGLRGQVLDLQSKNDLAGRYGQVCIIMLLCPTS
jgi:hypothetical protein